MRDMYSCLPFHTMALLGVKFCMRKGLFTIPTDNCITTGALLIQRSTANNWPHLCVQHYSVYKDSFTYPHLK